MSAVRLTTAMKKMLIEASTPQGATTNAAGRNKTTQALLANNLIMLKFVPSVFKDRLTGKHVMLRRAFITPEGRHMLNYKGNKKGKVSLRQQLLDAQKRIAELEAKIAEQEKTILVLRLKEQDNEAHA